MLLILAWGVRLCLSASTDYCDCVGKTRRSAVGCVGCGMCWNVRPSSAELSWVLAAKAMEQHAIAINPPEGEARRSPSRHYDLRSLASMQSCEET